MRIHLIRHGQTDWNIAGKIQGSTDIPLNDAGIRQANCLKKGMEKRWIGRVYSSPLQRAAETAAVIGKAKDVPVILMEGLKEVNFGQWEGRTWDEIQQHYPKEYKLWCINPVGVTPPGGEQERDIRLRCEKVVDEIMAQYFDDIAIVSHGATLAYIMAYLLRGDPFRKEIIVENASITTIHFSPLTDEYTLLETNDTSHLQM